MDNHADPNRESDATPNPQELLLGGEPRYTRADAARLAGVELDRASKLWRALGYARPSDDERVFTDADVEALREVTELQDTGLVDSGIEVALTRAMGQAMARLTEWQVSMLRELVIARVPDSTDQEAITSSGLEAAAAMLPRVERLQGYAWRRHLLAATERILTAAPSSTDTAPLSIGFVDIVGFTSLTRGMSEIALSEILEAFESDASMVVAEHGGRVVKTVGDEVMFAADTPSAAASIGLDLADRVSGLDDRPDLRIGLAHGPVLHRLGDFYGSVVNLAARLTALARPGTVLVDRELAAAVADDPAFWVRELRRVSVRGFSHLQPWLLRRGGGK
jgi:adenylate cyclase